MPRTATTLPPYLTSGASSRAHHALLVKLHEATSPQEEDEIISKEIEKARDALSVRGQSTSRISETLVILLHCVMLRHRAEDNVDFALVSALQLAEGGQTIAERRIGYLYLTERLPKNHELNLLLINTIRKDLSSSTSSHILLALNTIAKLPSSDLGPAVIPLLTSKSLLRHKLPAVRQRTFEALLSLHRLSQANEPFPLSMSKLLKALSHEHDLSVLAVIFRTIRYILETDVHLIETDEERLFILDKCLAAARVNEVTLEGQIALEIVTALEVVLQTKKNITKDAEEMVVKWICDRLEDIKSYHRWEAAFLLEVSSICTKIPEISSNLLGHISQLLLANHTAPSTSTSPALPSANDRVLALRCLAKLPTNIWDGVLGQHEMGVLMEGVNYVDNTIRKSTTRLLKSLSPDLLTMVLQTHLESIKTSTNLSLPMNLANSLTIEEKTTIGKYETASRALEVAEAGWGADAEGYAKGVIDVLDTLEEEAVQDTKEAVWDEGARSILARLTYMPSSFAQSFTTFIIESLRLRNRKPSDTMTIILTSITCEYLPFTYDQFDKTFDFFVNILSYYNASIQELILVTLISLIIRLQSDIAQIKEQTILQAIQQVQEGSARYLKKRCQEISIVMKHQLLEQVKAASESNTLANVLEAIISVSSEYSRKVNNASTTTAPLSTPLPPRADLSSSQLRYDAYKPPPRSNKNKEEYRDHFDDDSD
ncbi:uncharacterized protein L201_002304 [Kwoniella dendrophila CBS 6074]|uniref:Clathrin/coatomer adaptor adaptin-like N-terminal domain-containing protein n=1 Tax=Kwoniella dendrophila CBS 6074 TaxID=1295534 RepID=A0AAX4JPU1_9TREE